MLNLMRFRDVADYTANLELTPEVPISVAEAFNRYIEHTLPFLRESGGEIMFLSDGGEFLIGPEDERWDLVMMIRQSSAQSFLDFQVIKTTWPVSGIGLQRSKIHAFCL